MMSIRLLVIHLTFLLSLPSRPVNGVASSTPSSSTSWFNANTPTPYLFYRHGEPWNAWDWQDSYHYNPEFHGNARHHLLSDWTNISFNSFVQTWRKIRHRPFTTQHTNEQSIFEFLQSRAGLQRRLFNGLPKARTYFHPDIMNQAIKTTKDVRVVLFIGSMETVEYQGNGYFTHGGKLEHDAEQLEYLVELGKLPRDFLAISRAYRQILHDHFLKPLSQGKRMYLEGCCFVPTLAELKATHFLQNTLVYYPPPTPSMGRVALNPEVDWLVVAKKYNQGTIVKIDEVLADWALEAAYNFCLEATIYFEQKQGYLGAYVANGLKPPGGIMDQITQELRAALPIIIGDERLSNFWTYKYSNVLREENVRRQAQKYGLGKHADPAKINLNMWLTPDEACTDPTRGGMTIYDIGVDSAEEYFQSQHRTFHSELNVKMKEQKTRKVNIKYKRNRMILFNSRLIHGSGVEDNSQDLLFKKGYRNRRISLTWLFGDLMDKALGKGIPFGLPRL